MKSAKQPQNIIIRTFNNGIKLDSFKFCGTGLFPSLEDLKKFKTKVRVLSKVRYMDCILLSIKNKRPKTEFRSLFFNCQNMISDRPKMWKSKCMSVLKMNVQERIEGNQLDVRAENKMWLVRHLVNAHFHHNKLNQQWNVNTVDIQVTIQLPD